MNRVKIELFGAFRKYGDGKSIELDLQPDASLHDLRSAFLHKLREIHSEFDRDELVRVSAFADENSMLTDGSVISSNCKLAVLPPVCGG